MNQNFWEGFEKEALMPAVGKSLVRDFMDSAKSVMAKGTAKVKDLVQTAPLKPASLPAPGTKLKSSRPSTWLNPNAATLLKHKNTKYQNVLRPGQTGYHSGRLDPLQRHQRVFNAAQPSVWESMKKTPKRTKFLGTAGLAGGAYMVGRMHGGQRNTQPQGY